MFKRVGERRGELETVIIPYYYDSENVDTIFRSSLLRSLRMFEVSNILFTSL